MTINERGLVTGDKIRLIVSHPTWAKPFSTKLLTITNDKNFIYDLLKSLLEFVEYKNVPLDELLLEVQSTKIPRGTGRLRVTKNNIANKKSIICIKNTDTICLARAIVTAVANINKSDWTKSQLSNGFNKSRKLQKEEPLKLHEEAGVGINDYGNTLEDVNVFAKHLGIQINIVDNDHFNEIIHTTEEESIEGKMIYLYRNKNHSDVITSMPGFLGKAYYCHTCKGDYTRRDKHKCPKKCLACFKYDSNCKGSEITRDDCNRIFFGQECFDEHKRERGTGESDIVCDLVKKCLECKRTVRDLEKHICGYSVCNNCEEYCNLQDHKCYMKTVETKGGFCTKNEACKNLKPDDWCKCCKTRTNGYMFYDFETQQDTGTHIVNQVNVQDFCGFERTFNTIDDFCKFVFQDQHKHYTFVAHNSKSFDAQFVLKYCVENGIKPFCIYNGTKNYVYANRSLQNKVYRQHKFHSNQISRFPKNFWTYGDEKRILPTLL